MGEQPTYHETRWWCPRCGQPNRDDTQPCGHCSLVPGSAEAAQLQLLREATERHTLHTPFRRRLSDRRVNR